MKKSFEQIMTEARKAIEYVEKRDGTLNERDEPIKRTKNNPDPLADSLPILIDRTDDTPISLSQGETLRPYVILVSNTKEMRMIYEAIRHIKAAKFDEQTILDSIKHEQQHTDAARIAGIKSIFAVSIDKVSAGGVTTTPSMYFIGNSEHKQLTKLGLASVIVRPEIPSPSDIEKLKAMGYNSPQEVYNRIISSNDPELSSLLLPKSIKAGPVFHSLGIKRP